MCVDPISAAVMTAVGTGAGIYSKVKQGKAERKVAEQNAAAYEAQATRRLEKAEFDVANAQRDYAKFKGVVDSRTGASGFDPRNFAEIAAANAAEADLEYQSIRYTAAIEADQPELGLLPCRITDGRPKLYALPAGELLPAVR